jgi:hypothetical protein
MKKNQKSFVGCLNVPIFGDIEYFGAFFVARSVRRSRAAE